MRAKSLTDEDRTPRPHHRLYRSLPGATGTLLRVTLGVIAGTAGCTAQTREAPALPHSSHAYQKDEITVPAPLARPEQTLSLTLEQAEQAALRNNPQVSTAHLEALLGGAEAREKQSVELPRIIGDVTAAEAFTGSRIGASDSLTDSRLFTHAGTQVTASQVVTDFGHTPNLVASFRLSAQAKQEDELATRRDVVLATDRAFAGALRAGATLRVAQQNLARRQETYAQVDALARLGKRSTLDVSLADGTVAQAQLKLIDAQSDVQAAEALLKEVLCFDQRQEYVLVNEAGDEHPPPADEAALVELALQLRPEIAAANLYQQSAQRYARAEADQLRPTIRAIATVGYEPVRPGRYFISSWNEAIGVNISVPIFDGNWAHSAAHEAQLRAFISRERARSILDRIPHEVEIAWLQAQKSFQRRGTTTQMLEGAERSLQFAMSQYQLGLTSYMELSHAEVQQAEAQIAATDADYAYRLATAVLRYQVGSALWAEDQNSSSGKKH